MIVRRILVFLAILFMAFFAWRWFDRAGADAFLYKLKNLSVSPKPAEIDTVTGETADADMEKTIGKEWLKEILSDTLSDKTTNGAQDSSALLELILQPQTLQETVQYSNSTWVELDGLTGEVVINTGEVETISAQPQVQPHINSAPKLSPSAVKTPQPTAPQLSEQDKRDLEQVLQMFN